MSAFDVAGWIYRRAYMNPITRGSKLLRASVLVAEEVPSSVME